MSSSRLTIIAGTMPPRVIATTAFQPPSSGPLLVQPPGQRPAVAVDLVPADVEALLVRQAVVHRITFRSADSPGAHHGGSRSPFCALAVTTSMSGASTAFMPTTW